MAPFGTALLLCVPAVLAAPDDPESLVLEGIGSYQVMDPMFEGMRLVLEHRGETYSPAYLQGISGSAFEMGGICVCAPTCCHRLWPSGLAELLGYECEALSLEDAEPGDLAEAVKPIVERVKQEIRAGRAVLVWHAFTNAEWDVVCGFDEETREFLGRGSYKGFAEPARASETRMTRAIEFCPAYGAIVVGEKVREFDARAAELDALRFAVRRARIAKTEEEIAAAEWVYLDGIQAYDRWVSDFANDPARMRGAGDSYCLEVFRSCHRVASGFLEEIAPHFPEAEDDLRSAARHFRAEADALDACVPLLGWDAPEAPTEGRNALAAELLARARDEYVAGIEDLERALAAIPDATEE